MRTDNTLILFTKAPQICRVKTRMYPDLTHRECLYLHKKLNEHAVKIFKSNNKFRLIIYTTHLNRGRYHYPSGISIRKQAGLNLGSRMCNAIRQELKKAQRVVLIGSDCLTLNPDYIVRAFSKISKINDIVLGPTTDGGYVLVGGRKQNAFLFNNIPWGASCVLDKTLATAQKHGREINCLEKVSDIDSIKDIHLLKKQNVLPEWANGLIS
tara:strand:- start:772 stop:1404 length:633 start_codon:yes stop_codon:yes gene_type:complete